MSLPCSDPYAVLGVTAQASDDELDQAFRRLVRRLHPDTRRSVEPDADARLQDLLNAYATLRDPIRRAAYDRDRAGTADVVVPDDDPAPIRFGPVRWHPSRAGTPDRTR
ncbi:J domain-containing protein [Kribbella karoonensis]|uniref:J domain-containing protein n=1 Tax=Kribbella karoonensis TaxID=324851 RepID=A0ABN2E8Q3_9ACTN